MLVGGTTADVSVFGTVQEATSGYLLAIESSFSERGIRVKPNVPVALAVCPADRARTIIGEIVDAGISPAADDWARSRAESLSVAERAPKSDRPAEPASAAVPEKPAAPIVEPVALAPAPVAPDRVEPNTGPAVFWYDWSATVDGIDEIVISGDRVAVKHIRWKPPERMKFERHSNLPRRGTPDIWVDADEGRGKVCVSQRPSAQNDFVTIIRIEDNALGAAHYKLRIWYRAPAGVAQPRVAKK